MNALFSEIGPEDRDGSCGSREPVLSSVLALVRLRHLLLIDSSSMTRECFASMLETGCPEHRTWAAAGVAEAPDHAYELVLLNVHSARLGDVEVQQLAADVRARFGAGVPLAIITDRNEAAVQLEAIRHGYQGIIPTSLNSKLAAAAVNLMMAGGRFVPNMVVSLYAGLEVPSSMTNWFVLDPVYRSGITDRELQVLHLLRQGKPNKIIAFELQISESTVKIHVRHIMRKLNVTNRTQLAILQTFCPRPSGSFAPNAQPREP
jgi:DNA-binding NarL/FixJ family response regulator